VSEWGKVGNWTVEERDTRGVGPLCLYCQSALGGRHAVTCVVPQKTVRLRVTIEFDVTVPDSWTRHDVEFHRNESSSCASNGWRDLRDAMREAGSRGAKCFCGTAKYDVVDMYGNEWVV
jgi:hypothetical protein